jgi:hypothetical protein
MQTDNSNEHIEHVKMRLKGESPWGIVVTKSPDVWQIKIGNKVAGDYSAVEFNRLLQSIFSEEDKSGALVEVDDNRPHKHKFGDVLSCKELDGQWVPVEDYEYWQEVYKASDEGNT